MHQLGLDSRRLEVPGRKRLDLDHGGVIREILVQDGSRVEAGQVLMRLHDEQTGASAELLSALHDSQRALRARLHLAIRRTTPDLIVAHSLGSLLAFDYLCNDSRAALPATTLLSFGSQIGNLFVRNRLWPGRFTLPPVKQWNLYPSANAMPPDINNKWSLPLEMEQSAHDFLP